MRWVWGEVEGVLTLAGTLGATCQTLEDRPVGVSVAILAAPVRTWRLASLSWPPALLHGRVGCVPTGCGPASSPGTSKTAWFSLPGASFLFPLLGSPLQCGSGA